LSAALLYVAIVVIWIGVLIPRWLRHDNTGDGHTRLRRFSRHRDTGDQVDNAEPGTVLGSSAAPGVPGPPDDPGPGDVDGVVAATEADAGAYLPAPAADAEAAPRAGARSGPQRADRRARIIMARRRMLWMLVALTLLSLALTYVRLAAWWIVTPPVVMLLGYLMLLREAARADAEVRQRMAPARAAAHDRRAAAAERMADAGHAASAGAGPDRFAPARPARQPLPHAEVIDISARVGDQLYDQYADAKLRAVGD
jgi:hypothetical protein